jgi:hypothetical protein
MTQRQTLSFREVCGCLLLVHSEKPPIDREWDEYLAATTKYSSSHPRPRILIFTAGGTPSPSQRQRVEAIADVHYANTKVAVMTTSTFVQGVIKAFRLIRPIYQAFSPDRVDEALRYLEVSPSHTDEIRRTLAALRAEIAP